MTTNLDFTIAKRKIEIKEIEKSIEVVNHHINRLEESFDRLESIYRFNVNEDIKREAVKYLEKQDKLITIANDLRNRFKSLKPLRVAFSVKKQQDFDLAQLSIELDLLAEMHFRLKKTYITFLNTYYTKQRITNLMVA